MAEESEKRFHAVMDKLFHAPPKPRAKSTTSSTTITNFASSSGVQLPRGKKRPNSMVERLQKSLVSGGSIQTPLCRPWDRGDLLKRLATFKSMTWFAKPKVVSAVNCARRGWVSVDVDTIACESCGARLFFTTPPSWTQQQVEKAALVFSLKLDNGHKLLCPWIDNACDERLAQFPPMPAAVLVDEYKKRSSALLHLSALPVISSSAIDFMGNPQLEHFLKGLSIVEFSNGSADTSQTEYHVNECDMESSVSYYQAQKLISLCGWEPRSLPYLVDGKNQQNHCSKDLSHSDSSRTVSSGQNLSITVYSSEANPVEANDDPMASSGVQSDPKSVVLDCRLCGACVGLWSFSTISRPVELFRLVGYSEVNGENGSTHHRDLVDCIGRTPGVNGLGNETCNETREGILNTATTLSTSVNNRPSNLNLTIAGGPPPTKQNFRAMISLPVIGRNLRARISSGSDFRDHLCVKNSFQGGKNNAENALTGQGFVPEQVEMLQDERYDDRHCTSTSTLRNENDCHMSLNGTDSGGQEFPETSTPDFLAETSIPKSSDSVEGSGKEDDLPENAENVGTVNQAVGNLSCSQVGDSTITASDDHFPITNWEISENDTSMAVELVNCYLQEDPGTDTVCNAQADCRHSSAVKANLQQANNDVACCIGKNPEQAPLDDAIVFDPIMQHRHFCPWIASVDNAAPGWQQTLYALQRQKEFSCPSSKDAPSSSLIEVDDPVSSIKKLFMSPSAKKVKLTHG
ncbi:uncharacterized protein LOC132307790 [Cornus florida]|uniref:uncharacterized protein LOC132307790 n=1 Tax=Cornus florida TaxID=4283 RepID=UPI00289D6441|nr:uncharacterized protein LOC132307790 [Cornus florida]